MWPPPQPEEDGFFNDTFSSRQRGHRSHTFPSPFFTPQYHHPHSNFAFRDPFELFNALFREMDEIFSAPFPFGGIHPHRSQSLSPNSFFSPAMPTLPLDPFGIGFGQERGPRGGASETFVSTTINGVTQTTHTRRDEDVSFSSPPPPLSHTASDDFYRGPSTSL